MMQSSDHSTSAIDYYSQLLPSMSHSLQQPPPLQPLTSSAFTQFTNLTQQPSLQHTMSVADPFSPSWQHYNPPSPAARKQSSAAFGGGNANWLENAQQLMPSVSSGGLSALGGLGMQSQLLPHLSQLNASMLQQRSAQQPPALPLHPVVQQAPSSVFQPLPQRASLSNVSSAMQSSMQPQLNIQGGITQQQLAQLRAAQQMQQTYSPQRTQSIAGIAAMQQQQFAAPSQSLQTNPLSLLQNLRPTLSNVSPISQPAAQQLGRVAPLQPVTTNTVELATVLLSYLSSTELQRGLLYVNRLWRFKSLYVLQSRQVNIQVQLTHLYLGPFRASNMLELVFSLQVNSRLVNGISSSSSSAIKSPVQPLRPLQLPKSVPSSPASVTRTPHMSGVASNTLTSPSAIARATVCTPMAMSAVVKAKELSKSDPLLNSPTMLLSGGKHLSKKKLREAALLAESKYNSIIECGILSGEHTTPSASPATSQRTFKLYSPFFSKQVEVYTALSDPQQQTLYRASALAEKFDYATNKVGMYLSRRRLQSGGIYQATGFRSKPAGRTGLKCGGYFLTIEACKEFENHFQYGGLTEEQRKEKSDVGAMSAAGEKEGGEQGQDVDDGEMGDGEESEADDEENAAQTERPPSAGKLTAEDRPHGRPLSAVTKKLVDTGFGHSPSSSSASVGSSNSRKRSADDNPDDSPDSGDMSSSPSSSFKRVRSDDGGMNTTDSGSGSDSAGNMSTSSVGKRGQSGSDGEDSSDRSPGPSSRTTHTHSYSHSQLHSSTASTASSQSVGSTSSFHRSAFKAPTAMRSSSFQPSHSSMASVASSGSHSNNESSSPPPSARDISPSSSPGSQQVPVLPASAQFLPSTSSSSPSPPFAGSGFPSLSRWHSFASPMMSPTGNQTVFSLQPAPTNYVQLSSPPMGVSHHFNGLSLAGSAASQSSTTSMPAPVVPLSHAAAGQSLEAAFASALLQGGHAGGMGQSGPTASVGANGLLNLNLTLQQLQQLLSGQHATTNHLINQQQQLQQQQQQQFNSQQQQPSLLNFALMSAAGQATSGLQSTQLQQPIAQPVQFG